MTLVKVVWSEVPALWIPFKNAWIIPRSEVKEIIELKELKKQ